MNYKAKVKNASLFAISANPTSPKTNANDVSSGFNNNCCFIDYFYSKLNLSLLNKFIYQHTKNVDK